MGDVATRHDNLRIPITAKDRIPGDTPYYGANGIQDYVEGYTHEGEFVLVAEDGATDLDNYPVQLISGLSWVNNHAHVIKAIPDVAQNRFIMHLIKSMDIASYLVGGTRSKLNAEVLMGIELKLPSNSEQIYIGALLSALDSLITLHQRMCSIFCFCAHGSRNNFASILQGQLRILRYLRPMPKMRASPSALASGTTDIAVALSFSVLSPLARRPARQGRTPSLA